MAKQAKVLIAGLFHETNTFLEGHTAAGDFQLLRGQQILDCAGDSSPLAGAVEAAERFGWVPVPAIDMRGMPGAVVKDRVIEAFWRDLEPAARTQGPFDGILLVLHGAMVSESIPDVEGWLLEKLRSVPGLETVPVCAVLDLHANVSAAMASLADVLVGYQENPHTDAKKTAMRAARILNCLISAGQRPATVWKHAGVMWPATGTGTANDPVRLLERLAREIEQSHPEILVMNVFPGFAYADVPDAGVSFTAVTLGSAEDASRHAGRLVALAQQNRDAGIPRELPLKEAMERLKRHTQGPVLLVEPADNVGAGTSGRGVAVLKALLDHSIPDSAVIIQAPEMVETLAECVPGQRVSITLGSSYDPEPLPVQAELLSLSDGKFELEDPHSHLASIGGGKIDMGRCAVVRSGGTRILLTSRRTPPFDLAQLRSQGIAPESLFAIGVKAAVAHQRAYGPIAKGSYTVSSPGPCTGDLRSLPYRHVRRPVYPLDA